MAKKSPEAPKAGTSKRRTREHIIADLSENFVHRIILDGGCSGARMLNDYGYDFSLESFDANGNVEPGFIFLQLKATDAIHRYEQIKDDTLAFPVDRRDYELWSDELYPVFLILFDAVGREAYWQHMQAFFADTPVPAKSKTVTVKFPKRHVFGIGTIHIMRRIKNDLLQKIKA